jgi:hypothetical protein
MRRTKCRAKGALGWQKTRMGMLTMETGQRLSPQRMRTRKGPWITVRRHRTDSKEIMHHVKVPLQTLHITTQETNIALPDRYKGPKALYKNTKNTITTQSAWI